MSYSLGLWVEQINHFCLKKIHILFTFGFIFCSVVKHFAMFILKGALQIKLYSLTDFTDDTDVFLQEHIPSVCLVIGD